MLRTEPSEEGAHVIGDNNHQTTEKAPHPAAPMAAGVGDDRKGYHSITPFGDGETPMEDAAPVARRAAALTVVNSQEFVEHSARAEARRGLFGSRKR